MTKQKLFLIDGIGAIISAFIVGVVFVIFQQYIGLPKSTLLFLAIIPCFYAVYDFFCYKKLKRNFDIFIKNLAIANLLYCLISIIVIYLHYQSLTKMAFVYFVLEIAIVFALGIYELTIAKRIRKNFEQKLQ